MHCEGCGFCLTKFECLACGRVFVDKDVWLFKKWKQKSTWIPSSKTNEAIALGGKVSALMDEEPSLN